jgi:hypothetical protein
MGKRLTSCTGLRVVRRASRPKRHATRSGSAWLARRAAGAAAGAFWGAAAARFATGSACCGHAPRRRAARVARAARRQHCAAEGHGAPPPDPLRCSTHRTPHAPVPLLAHARSASRALQPPGAKPQSHKLGSHSEDRHRVPRPRCVDAPLNREPKAPRCRDPRRRRAALRSPPATPCSSSRRRRATAPRLRLRGASCCASRQSRVACSRACAGAPRATQHATARAARRSRRMPAHAALCMAFGIGSPSPQVRLLHTLVPLLARA